MHKNVTPTLTMKKKLSEDIPKAIDITDWEVKPREN